VGYSKFGKTIPELTALIRANNIRKGFRPAGGGPGDNTFGDYIALAHSELSEALEAYRDHRLADATADHYNRMHGLCSHGEVRGECRAVVASKPEGVGSELADTVIRLLDMADVFGIDLEAEIVRKIAYNATRPYQHGGRTLADAMQAPVTRTTDKKGPA
jgi:NTP pyrophosphatase (non-canonical NTP hydrolase)